MEQTFWGKYKTFLLAGGALILIFGYALVNKGCSMHAHNKYHDNYRAYEAQLTVVESYFDTVWKIIDQKGQVLQQYQGDNQKLMDSYTKVFSAIMAEDGKGLSTPGTVQPASQGGNIVIANSAGAVPPQQTLLWSFFASNNMKMDMELYRDLTRTIETRRLEFHEEQKKAANLASNVNYWLETEPWAGYNTGLARANFKPITSSRAHSAVENRGDDNTGIFQK